MDPIEAKFSTEADECNQALKTVSPPPVIHSPFKNTFHSKARCKERDIPPMCPYGSVEKTERGYKHRNGGNTYRLDKNKMIKTAYKSNTREFCEFTVEKNRCKKVDMGESDIFLGLGPKTKKTG